MRKTAKRFLLTAILAALLVSCLTPLASAAETLTELQRAVCETAMAYYYRGSAVQYDSAILTDGTDPDQRRSDYTSPEDATDDEIMYSVCSAYCFEVYYDALGYKLNGSPTAAATANLVSIPADDPIVAYRWEISSGKDWTVAVSDMEAIMQPGDIVVAHLGDSGHAMLYIGEYADGTPSLIHCGGNKYSMEAGTDPVETKASQPTSNGGAIRIDEANKFLLSTTSTYPLKSARKICLLRPLNVLKASDLTENAKARLKYKGLNINRVADHDKFRDVEAGGEITVTIDLQNNSDAAYTVPVTEKIPAGAALKAGSVTGSGSASGNTINWNVSLAAGETKRISYTVTVTGKRGETISLGGGNAGGIRSNVIPVKIGGKHLTGEQAAKLKDIKTYAAQIEQKVSAGAEFGSAVYETVLGIDPQYLTAGEIIKQGFNRSRTGGAIRLDAKTETPETYQKTAAMEIPYYVGGTAMHTGGGGHSRVLDLRPFHLYAGDVILRGNSAGSVGSMETCIYLGDDQVAYVKNGKLTVSAAEKELLKNFRYEFFFGLRPSLAYDDLATDAKATAKPISFPDVKSTDWFYSYVMELAKDGIVGGMSDGTFQPAGTLTYGQALKLLICALDTDVGNAASGHWAGNYLSAAQSKGWISGSVNLDAGISRLSFCQIAAKAKGLTEQPESNPFTDTSDASVLALNKAGVIGGMGEGIFSPNTTLTRAQISKIIVELRKV